MDSDIKLTPDNWRDKIEDSRLKDSDGDLGYTIHINKAKQICEELENYYLKQIKNILLKGK